MKKIILTSLYVATAMLTAQKSTNLNNTRTAKPDSAKSQAQQYMEQLQRTSGIQNELVPYGSDDVWIRGANNSSSNPNTRIRLTSGHESQFYLQNAQDKVGLILNAQGRPSLTFMSFTPNSLGYSAALPSLELNKDGSVSFYKEIWGTRNASPWQNTGKMLTMENDGKVSIGDNRLTNLATDYKLSVDGKIVANQIHSAGLSFFGPTPDAALLAQLNNCAALPVDNVVPPLRLFANGTIGAMELRVNPITWCDYVFEKDYKLKDLKEVEAYITTNKHLPEVPSEKEVKEGGVYVSEMFKAHMKKIEELTLYLIEQNKKIDQLSADNQKLASDLADLQKNITPKK